MGTLSGPANQLALAAFRVYNGMRPNAKPKALTVALDFSAAAQYVVDLELIEQMGQLSFVQAIFADNFLNNAQLLITPSLTQQPLRWPAKSQGYLPILGAPGSKFTCALAGGAGVTTLCFLNFVVPAVVWLP